MPELTLSPQSGSMNSATGCSGQGDAEAVGAGYKCCLCCARYKMSSLLGISEPELGVPGQGDSKRLERVKDVVCAM
jgi:hypothetical protein